MQHPILNAADRRQREGVDKSIRGITINRVVCRFLRDLNREKNVSICERKKEIRRRRKRRENYAAMKPKVEKADAALREKMREKLCKLTPGADAVIKAWGIE